MKKTVTIAAILLIAALAFGNGTEWFKGSFEQAKATAQREGKLLLIDFYSDG